MAVINTCTVTNQADANARHLVRRLRRRHPDLRIIVAGCSTAFREADYRALQALEEVDGVVPGHDPAAVARELPGLAEPDPAAAGTPLGRNARGTRAWLKIQDGCDRKCSFCATRIARGVSVSRPPEEVVAEAVILARVHPELVITGIHIGHYGRDLEPAITLAGLCERLLERVPARLRLSSIEATEIDDRLVDLLAESGGRLAPHLHVPLQSGSDRVLRLMRRWHTREAYRSRVLAISERAGPLGLGADIIVGFPGEGQEEFAETRALVEELPFSYLHVFPYSVRDGTAAATLPGSRPGRCGGRPFACPPRTGFSQGPRIRGDPGRGDGGYRRRGPGRSRPGRHGRLPEGRAIRPRRARRPLLGGPRRTRGNPGGRSADHVTHCSGRRKWERIGSGIGGHLPADSPRASRRCSQAWNLGHSLRSRPSPISSPRSGLSHRFR